MSVAWKTSAVHDDDATRRPRPGRGAGARRSEWSVGAEGRSRPSRGRSTRSSAARRAATSRPRWRRCWRRSWSCVRSDTGWDDYQLERTYSGAAGPRRLLIRCRRQRRPQGGHVGVIMNAADHERIEEDLADLIDRYRLLVEISPDMIVVHQDGIVRYINPTGLDLDGGRRRLRARRAAARRVRRRQLGRARWSSASPSWTAPARCRARPR